MKKLSLFLSFILLTACIWVLPVSANEQKASFDVAETGQTIIYGNQYTYTYDAGNRAKAATSSLPAYLYTTKSTGYEFATYDINVEKSGMYKVSVKYGTTDTNKLSLHRGYLHAANNDTVAYNDMNADVLLGEFNCEISSDIWASKTTAFGAYYFDSSITTRLGVFNNGGGATTSQVYIFQVIIEPVDEPIIIERLAKDNDKTAVAGTYASWYNNITDAVTGIKPVHVRLDASTDYIQSSLSVPEDSTYSFSAYGALPYRGYQHKIKITAKNKTTGAEKTAIAAFSGKEGDTNIGTTNAFIWRESDTALALEAGEYDIKINNDAVDLYLSKYRLTKIADTAETAYVLNATADTIIPASGTSSTPPSAFNVISANGGKYDVFMNVQQVVSSTGVMPRFSAEVYVNGSRAAYTSIINTVPTTNDWNNTTANPYADIKIGTIDLPKGVSNVQVKTSVGGVGCTYQGGKIIIRKGNITATDVLAVEGGTDIDLNGLNSVKLQNTNIAKGTITLTEEKAGWYRLYTKVQGEGIPKTLNLTVKRGSVTEEKTITLAGHGQPETIDLGCYPMASGANPIEITSNTNGLILMSKSVYLSDPIIVSLFKDEGNVANTVNKPDTTAAKLYARIDTTGMFKGNEANSLICLAVYDEDGKMCYVAADKAPTTGNVLTLGFKDMEYDNTKTYKAKVFVWDSNILTGTCRVYE